MEKQIKELKWGDFFDFYMNKYSSCKEKPIGNLKATDQFYSKIINSLNPDDEYVKLARSETYAIIDDNTSESRLKITQEWHFLVSYLWEKEKVESHNLNTHDQNEQIEIVKKYFIDNRKTSEVLSQKMDYLPCLELFMWMLEVTGVINENGELTTDEKMEINIKECAQKIKNDTHKSARSVWTEINDLFHINLFMLTKEKVLEFVNNEIA